MQSHESAGWDRRLTRCNSHLFTCATSDAEPGREALSIQRYDERDVTELRALTDRSWPLARHFAELFGAA